MSSIPAWIVTLIGFIAQVLFAGRTILQWFKSEKARKVLAPSSYWVLSVLAAWIMFIYGVLRQDFAIILGQVISYYIYLWNLNAKGIWSRLGLVLQTILLATPLLSFTFLLKDAGAFVDTFFRSGVPAWLIIFGSAGQILFTLRFVYQWIYSRRKGESSLPTGFWVISLLGSATIIAYGIFRSDIVLILGQSFGFVAYIRNLIIGSRNAKTD